jgi:hypothetical protein
LGLCRKLSLALGWASSLLAVWAASGWALLPPTLSLLLTLCGRPTLLVDHSCWSNDAA